MSFSFSGGLWVGVWGENDEYYILAIQDCITWMGKVCVFSERVCDGMRMC